ncbi:MAG: hypothetical protein ACRDFB_03655 [Rhabdochlamydiaceae bacterium]
MSGIKQKNSINCKNCGKSFSPYYTKEEKIGLCNHCMMKPFEVISVARADLENLIPTEDIAKFTDEDMGTLANIIGGGLNGVDSRVFWDSLGIGVKVMLHDKKQKEK